MLQLLLAVAMIQDETPLPPVLGEATTVAAWEGQRAELRDLFEEHVYGRAPEAPELEVALLRRGTALDGRATYDELELRFAVVVAEARTTSRVVRSNAIDGRVSSNIGRCASTTRSPAARLAPERARA